MINRRAAMPRRRNSRPCSNFLWAVAILGSAPRARSSFIRVTSPDWAARTKAVAPLFTAMLKAVPPSTDAEPPLFITTPLAVALGAYLVPLQIGAADLVAPRLNLFSVWLRGAGGLIMYSGFLTAHGAAQAGWTEFLPVSGRVYAPCFGCWPTVGGCAARPGGPRSPRSAPSARRRCSRPG